jgi:hypothetical protein
VGGSWDLGRRQVEFGGREKASWRVVVVDGCYLFPGIAGYSTSFLCFTCLDDFLCLAVDLTIIFGLNLGRTRLPVNQFSKSLCEMESPGKYEKNETNCDLLQSTVQKLAILKKKLKNPKK